MTDASTGGGDSGAETATSTPDWLEPALSETAPETADVASDSSNGSPDVPPESTLVADPSDAFQALGNEVRMEVLAAMLERVDGEGSDRASFSELFEVASPDTSAGFAYHLDELVGHYLRKTDDGYAFTYAGEKIARAIAAGAYTRRASSPSIAIDDSCPLCDSGNLRAAAADNVVSIACEECERTLCRLGFPPSGFDAHGEALPAAFDRHHRHRISLLVDGVCPECAGAVDGRLEAPDEGVAADLPAALADHVQAAFDCRSCGYDLSCPVTLSVLEHPDALAFYRDHDEDLRDRPIWNVGPEWTEVVVADEPTIVRVATELDGEVLELYVDDTASIVATRRVDDA